MTRNVVAVLLAGVVAGAVLSGTAQQPPSPDPQAPAPADPAQPTPDQASTASSRVFTGDAGLIFFPVRPERTADFEKIMAKLKAALAASADPVRQQQAAGWKVFKAVEPGPNGTVLYVFLIDPAVKGSDYAFWNAMYEAFPAEMQELFRLYTAATAGGQSLLNLQLVQAFGAPAQDAGRPVRPDGGPPVRRRD